MHAGQDRALRLFSTIQDQQSRELSQHHTARRAKRLKVSEEELKLPRVIGLDTCQVLLDKPCLAMLLSVGVPMPEG